MIGPLIQCPENFVSFESGRDILVLITKNSYQIILLQFIEVTTVELLFFPLGQGFRFNNKIYIMYI